MDFGEEIENSGDDQAVHLEALQREIELNILSDLWQHLPADPERATLDAFYIRGLTVKAIAELRHEAVSTVTTRLTRLRRDLRAKMLQRIKQGG